MDNRHLTVLVIDPSETVRNLLRRALERFDRKVLLAATVETGLALLKHADEWIDVVIADVLPGMDGDELADDLRRHDPAVAILLISSGVNEPAARYPELVKPFTLEALEQRIAAVTAPRTPADAERTAQPSG